MCAWHDAQANKAKPLPEMVCLEEVPGFEQLLRYDLSSEQGSGYLKQPQSENRLVLYLRGCYLVLK